MQDKRNKPGTSGKQTSWSATWESFLAGETRMPAQDGLAGIDDNEAALWSAARAVEDALAGLAETSNDAWLPRRVEIRLAERNRAQLWLRRQRLGAEREFNLARLGLIGLGLLCGWTAGHLLQAAVPWFLTGSLEPCCALLGALAPILPGHWQLLWRSYAALWA